MAGFPYDAAEALVTYAEIRPDGWNYHWENPNGEVVMSNNTRYDPNHDISINRSDFKRSPVFFVIQLTLIPDRR